MQPPPPVIPFLSSHAVRLDPDLPPLIIDTGSGFTKCGFASEDAPIAKFPTIVGRPKSPGIMVGMDAKDIWIGDEAQAKRGILKLKYPIEHGFVTNWNDMERLWHHIFYNELRVTPEEQSVLLTEPPLNPMNNREKMTSIMFETFNVVGLYVAVHGVCSLVASGRSTGVVVESGDGVTHIMPIYEGHDIFRAGRRMNLAGRDMTEYLVKILAERGYEMTTSAEREIVRQIKEGLCFVAEEYHVELERQENTGCWEQEFTLPDDSKMVVGSERFRTPEIMFKPSFIGFDSVGVHEHIFDCIQTCDRDLQSVMFRNVVLSGGSTMFDGYRERLEKEIRILASPSVELNVIAPTAYSRNLSVWRGASVLASMPGGERMWISKEEYDDVGGSIVHRMCF